MSKFKVVCAVGFMLFGCIRTNDQKEAGSDSAALKVAEVKKPLNACLKLMIFTCAETKNPSPSDCNQNSDFAAMASLREKEGDKKSSEEIIQVCQRFLDVFEERAKISGFENAETMVRANIASPEALKKFESSLSRK